MKNIFADYKSQSLLWILINSCILLNYDKRQTFDSLMILCLVWSQYYRKVNSLSS